MSRLIIKDLTVVRTLDWAGMRATLGGRGGAGEVKLEPNHTAPGAALLGADRRRRRKPRRKPGLHA